MSDGVFDNITGPKITRESFTVDCTEYTVSTAYFRCAGVQQVPVAGKEGTPSEFVQWSAPFGRKVVHWLAKAYGDLPVLPDWESKDPNEELLDYHVTPVLPGLSPDGRRIMTVTGMYVYGLKVPVDRNQGFKMGALPFGVLSKSANVLRGGNFGDVL